MFKKELKVVSRKFTGVSRALQMCFKKVSRVFLKEYLRIKIPNNKGALRVFLKQQIIIIIKTQCNKSI